MYIIFSLVEMFFDVGHKFSGHHYTLPATITNDKQSWRISRKTRGTYIIQNISFSMKITPTVQQKFYHYDHDNDYNYDVN